MRTIKIDFRNMWGGFFKHDNIVFNTLSLRYNVIVDEQDPDIVVCQVSPPDHGSPPPAAFVSDRIGKSRIVHWLVESIDRTGDPDYTQCDFSFSSCKFNDDRNVRIPLWTMYVNWFGDRGESYNENRNQAFLLSPERLLSSTPLYSPKTKFCSVLTNNDMGLRKEAYPKFINFGIDNGLLVESRGRAFTNMGPPIEGNEKNKLDYIDEFSFNLCFDNGESAGWITEKIIHPLYKGVIPIYWGCPDVGEEFNEDAFIHVRNFNTLGQLHNKVLEIYHNRKLFNEIQEQPCFPNNKIPDCANPEQLLEKLEKVVA